MENKLLEDGIGIEQYESIIDKVTECIGMELVNDVQFYGWLTGQFSEIKNTNNILKVLQRGDLKKYYQESLKGTYKDYEWNLVELKVSCWLGNYYMEAIDAYEDAPF
jgi:hypothetical protein